MESLELLSNFFKYLSDKNSINISLEYDAFNESQISQQDIEILAALKNTISSFNFVKNAKQEKPKSFCSICKRKFAHPQLLKYHEKVLHNKLDNLADFNFSSLDIFVCINCNQCFKTKREFDSHLNCEKRFEIPPDLLSFHNKFSCGYCNESFKIFDRIEFHLKSISCQTNQRSQNSFQCQICSSEFKTKSSYHKHLFKSHQKVQVNFQCDQCPKKFIKKVYLTNHKLKFHNLEKNFMCSICGEKYLTEGTFKKHQKTHSNPVTFQCEFCPKTFKRKDKLNTHLSIHTGNRPFQCQVCPKKFVNKTKLKEHERRHFGEKRFSCLLCGKLYAGSFDLRKHLEKIHPKVAQDIKPNVPLTPQILASLNK